MTFDGTTFKRFVSDISRKGKTKIRKIHIPTNSDGKDKIVKIMNEQTLRPKFKTLYTFNVKSISRIQ